MPIKKNHASNKMNFSSIVNEVIRTIYLSFFYEDISHKKKPTKHPSNVYSYSYTPKSIIKHTGHFHLDITPKSIKKTK